MKYEVRCCCIPQNLLGHIDLPIESPRPGQTVHIATINGDRKVLEFDMYMEKQTSDSRISDLLNFDFRNKDIRHMAIKSNEKPMEWFLDIPEFIPLEKQWHQ